MATKKTTTEETVGATKTTATGNSVVNEGRQIWIKYGKIMTIVGAVIVLGLAGWFGYEKFVQEPKELKANELIFPAENLFDQMTTTGFNKDSVNIALNGGDLDGKTVTGLLKIINNYGGTEAGNRATYMAGASYLNIGEYAKAIKFLKDFNAGGADQVKIKAYELIGHAYAEQKNTAEALNYFKKATEVNPKDEAFTAEALLLAGKYATATNKPEEAKTLLNKLKNEYPANQMVMSGEIDKLLASMGEFE